MKKISNNKRLEMILALLREVLKKGTVRTSADSTHDELSARPRNELSLELTYEEATYLLVVLPQEHSVNQRLRKMMGF
jgi:hypothetical protein